MGWVVVMGEWLGQAGPLGVVLAFIAGGLIMMLVGLCYAEMATLLPVSGGEVAYAYEAFGVEASFAVRWLLALAYIATTAFEAISVGWILSALLPGVEGAPLYSNHPSSLDAVFSAPGPGFGDGKLQSLFLGETGSSPRAGHEFRGAV